MIILMFNDPQHINSGNNLAALYYPLGMNMSTLIAPDCFNRPNLPERISFLGHASSTHFGSGTNEQLGITSSGRTPQEFVDYLIDTCHLPKSVKVIDLLGCEIGFIKNGKTYVAAVTERFNQRKYDLRINAFTNLNYNGPPLVGMCLWTSSNGEVRISGWTQKSQAELDSLRKEKLAILRKKDESKIKLFQTQKQLDDIPTHVQILKQNIENNKARIFSLNIHLQQQNENLVRTSMHIHDLEKEKSDALGINRKNPFFRDVETINIELEKAKESYEQQIKATVDLTIDIRMLEHDNNNMIHTLQHSIPASEQAWRVDLIKLQQHLTSLELDLEKNKKATNAVQNEVVLLQTIDFRNALDGFPNNFQFVTPNVSPVNEALKTQLPNGHPYFTKLHNWQFIADPNKLMPAQVHHINLGNTTPQNPIFSHVSGLESFNESFSFRSEQIDHLIEAHLLTEAQADTLTPQETAILSRPEINDLILEGELDINVAKKIDNKQIERPNEHLSSDTHKKMQDEIPLKSDGHEEKITHEKEVIDPETTNQDIDSKLKISKD